MCSGAFNRAKNRLVRFWQRFCRSSGGNRGSKYWSICQASDAVNNAKENNLSRAHFGWDFARVMVLVVRLIPAYLPSK